MGLLEDRVAVVTGGTSASGAPAPYSGRARVPGSHSRVSRSRGEAIVAEIKAAGASAVFIEADLVTTGSIPAAIARAVASYGRLVLPSTTRGSSAAAQLKRWMKPRAIASSRNSS
jgi:NAD(P)-dependent dehydrogenase (short-subunit alcohol dehydrogenase family)